MESCAKMNEDLEKLIETVRKFASLWDVTFKSFKDSKEKSTLNVSLDIRKKLKWLSESRSPSVICIYFTCRSLAECAIAVTDGPTSFSFLAQRTFVSFAVSFAEELDPGLAQFVRLRPSVPYRRP